MVNTNDTRKDVYKQITLSFSTDNEIGDAGAASMSEVLKSNTTLVQLDLWSEDQRKERRKRLPSTIH